MEDRQIIRLYQQRDETAIEKTAEKYTAYCRSVAGRILADPGDAEEAVNDTWLAAWNSIPPHLPERLGPYLARLTRNISLNILRAERARKRGSGQTRLVYEELSEWLGAEQNVEQEVEARALAVALNVFLDSLSGPERRVFVSRYWLFLSISEIADRQGFSESKIKSMLFRTRKKLRDKLEKEGYL